MIRQIVVGCRVLGIRFQNACLLLNGLPGQLRGAVQLTVLFPQRMSDVAERPA